MSEPSMKSKLITIGIIAAVTILGLGISKGISKRSIFTEAPNPPYSGPAGVFTEPVTFNQLAKTYDSASYFSFRYPENFRISPVQTSNQEEIITIENAGGSGFQISIMPFDETGPITPERIWRDIPDAEIKNPQWADLDSVQTLVFEGDDPDLGATFEIWTVNKGRLFQVMGPITAKDLIIATLETWRWK